MEGKPAYECREQKISIRRRRRRRLDLIGKEKLESSKGRRRLKDWEKI